MTSKPCLTCGLPSDGSHCPEHEPKSWQHREGSARARGYSTAWDKLSRRARRLQPFCTDCNGTDGLQLDHTPRTWERIDAGKVVRLKDTGGVVCGPCNLRRGAGRDRVEPVANDALTGAQNHGESPVEASKGPGRKPQTASLSAGLVDGGPLLRQVLDEEFAIRPEHLKRPVAGDLDSLTAVGTERAVSELDRDRHDRSIA